MNRSWNQSRSQAFDRERSAGHPSRELKLSGLPPDMVEKDVRPPLQSQIVVQI